MNVYPPAEIEKGSYWTKEYTTLIASMNGTTWYPKVMQVEPPPPPNNALPWCQSSPSNPLGAPYDTSLVQYEATMAGGSYGNGIYSTWSNSIYGYENSTDVPFNESAPSLMFGNSSADGASPF